MLLLFIHNGHLENRYGDDHNEENYGVGTLETKLAAIHSVPVYEIGDRFRTLRRTTFCLLYTSIQAAGREDEIAVIGFDASAEEQNVIAEGGCYKGSIMQFPSKLAETAVECVDKVLAGETLQADTTVEVGVYTKDKIFYASDLK